jgi:hypothetical protein
MKRLPVGLLTAALAAACSGVEEPPEPEVAFPADYASSFVEVRDCRKSADHELEQVRVLVDPVALEPYADRTEAFSDGALVLKEQYESSDSSCSGPITQWTVMRKRRASSNLGWDWQRVDANRRVVPGNSASCAACHSACGGSSTSGYDFTCADP